MTGKGAGQWTRLCAGALLAFAVLSAPVGAQDSGGGLPPQKVEDPAAVDPAPGVRADSTGALIPQVQRPPQDEDEPVSGGFQPQSGGAQAGGKAPSSGGGSSGAGDGTQGPG